jgi:hypothetical protein
VGWWLSGEGVPDVAIALGYDSVAALEELD